ncbi:hypothetical protein Spb1_14280 [Planctopirus ephydatiae]|uniref:Uncharacterized protein n=1 Tax=Planctopirus ephydatiae TaxID=2528019 RepID=A0A518GM62_9PLAN|nr:hypothetical protein Spb1_14280 [Planctopirus ephydatiae]
MDLGEPARCLLLSRGKLVRRILQDLRCRITVIESLETMRICILIASAGGFIWRICKLTESIVLFSKCKKPYSLLVFLRFMGEQCDVDTARF